MNGPVQQMSPTSQADPVLDDLLADFANQLELGEAVDAESYVREHPERAEELRRLLPAIQVLADLERVTGAETAASSHPSMVGLLGDFRLLREVGRGGMGVVYEAEQISLGRRVALKVLPFASTLDPKQLQRFKNEAQAAAHLHHQHIVPVYATGCERAVHFYAMQFIEGQSLAEVIADLRKTANLSEPETPSPDLDSAKVPGSDNLTQIYPGAPAGRQSPSATTAPVAALSTERSTSPAFFRSVASLGREAAEALEYSHELGVIHRDIKPGNLLVDVRGNLWIADFGLAQIQGDNKLTLSGDLLGTLRYMSPEQALAKRVLVDQRTDIYSLGATLYEFLTLEPVFGGGDRQELLRQIAFEEPKALRRVNKAIPAELETIVHKALEKNPADRYATAQELADDLERFVKDEPIRARRPRLRQRLGRWCRRHKAVVWSAATVLSAVLAMLAGTIGWVMRDRATRQAETARVVEAALHEEEALRKDRKYPEALSAARRAAGLLAGGETTEDLRQRMQVRLADEEMIARLEDIRLQILSGWREQSFDYAGADREYARTFRDYGIDVDHLSLADAAMQFKTRAIGVELATAVDHWAVARRTIDKGGERWLHLLAVARVADPDRFRDQLRDTLQNRDRKALEQLASTASIEALPAPTVALLGDALLEAGAVPQAIRVLRSGQVQYPGDFWINNDLGEAFMRARPPAWDSALRFYGAALAIRPGSAMAHNNVGHILHELKKTAEAAEAYQKAIALDPNFALGYNNLATALDDMHRFSEAVAAYEKAIKLEPKFAIAHSNLGLALYHQHRMPEAISALQEAIRLKPKYATAYNHLGTALESQGKLAEAALAFQKAIALKPGDATFYNDLGITLRKQRKLAEAAAAHNKAIALKPDDTSFYNSLGTTLHEQRKLPEAVAAFTKAIQLKPDYALPYHNLGVVFHAQQKLPEAVAALRKAIHYKPDYADSYRILGHILQYQKHLPEAIDAYRKCLALDPKDNDTYYRLGLALHQDHRPFEAETAYRKAIQLKPDTADAYWAYCDLGIVQEEQGKRAEALAAHRKAIQVKPDFAGGHYNVGVNLLDDRKYAEAIALFRKALQLQPDMADAHWNLGIALQEQGRFAEALIELQRGHDLGSVQPKNTAPSAHWIRETQRLIDLEPQFPMLLNGQARPKNAADALTMAKLCQLHCRRYYAAAARFFGEAFAADPKLAQDLRSGYRYSAACAAALAGCGQGTNAATLDVKACIRLREQALAWLRADLTAWQAQLQMDPGKARGVVIQTMRHWQHDGDFDGVRSAKALAKLPENERREWQKLWHEVEALARAEAPGKKAVPDSTSKGSKELP